MTQLLPMPDVPRYELAIVWFTASLAKKTTIKAYNTLPL